MTDYAAIRIANPDNYFETPQHVLDDVQLTAKEKRKVLNSLKLDAELISTAKSENMGDGKVPRLKPIQAALVELDRRERGDGTANLFQKILIALPSDVEEAVGIVEISLKIAETYNASVRLFSVLAPPMTGVSPMIGTPVIVPTVMVDPQISRDAVKQRETVVQQFVDSYALQGQADQVVRLGTPAHEIVSEAADWNADLIILGSHNRSWLEFIIDPSVSRHVARKTKCAVLILPE
ncbi:hypothetical protein GCM10009069_30310 [Algimonas arctica]|uniref:UspA domain-containing protein n=1 Tax=Algimonas arctica TaxID=1479486 RepID=A0A8J3CTV8_9PROT|nr:universal stress protein [Algimonas arctica]GHB05998.1 hypothetical protein GCM10009069_30310 [Algimonas arctica]